MTNEERKAALEAIIYAADEPATLEQLTQALGDEKLAVQASLDELVAGYANEERGIEIRAVAGGYKLYTKAQHHDVVRRFIKSLRPPLRLSMPALETLAVIAYKQPIARAGIERIRGTSSDSALETLLMRELVALNQARLFVTTRAFLDFGGLRDLADLPPLQDLASDDANQAWCARV